MGGRGTRGRSPAYYDFRGRPLHLSYVHPSQSDKKPIEKNQRRRSNPSLAGRVGG